MAMLVTVQLLLNDPDGETTDAFCADWVNETLRGMQNSFLPLAKQTGLMDYAIERFIGCDVEPSTYQEGDAPWRGTPTTKGTTT